MSKDVEVRWECDWCGTQGRSWDQNKLPTGWQNVTLRGVNYKPDRDLCQQCTWRFHEETKGFDKMAEDYWWEVVHSIPRAPDAKPPGDLF